MSNEQAGRKGRRYFLIEPLDITEEEAIAGIKEMMRRMSRRRRQEYIRAVEARMELEQSGRNPNRAYSRGD